MKTKLILLVLIFVGCSKENYETIPPVKQFTATLTVKPTDKSLYYHVYASNEKNPPLGFWLYIGTVKVKDIKNGVASFGFDAPTYCGVTIVKDQQVYGISQEVVIGNIKQPIDFNSVKIH